MSKAIGIAYNKGNINNYIWDAINKGVKASNNELVFFGNAVSNKEYFPKCDLIIRIGGLRTYEKLGVGTQSKVSHNPRIKKSHRHIYKNHSLRQNGIYDNGTLALLEYLYSEKNIKTRILCLDAGYINHLKSTDMDLNTLTKTTNKDYHNLTNTELKIVYRSYHGVSFDDIKTTGSHYNQRSPSDRLDRLKLDIKPWRHQGTHILVSSGNPTGWGGGIIDIKKWRLKTIEYLLDKTDRPIRLTLHPRERLVLTNASMSYLRRNSSLKMIPNHPRVSIVTQMDTHINQDLENCWCMIGDSTNSTIDAIIRGIPVICPFNSNMAYSIADHTLKSVYNPTNRDHDRKQFLQNLAYCQWSTKEIANGEMFAYMIRNINKGSQAVKVKRYFDTNNFNKLFEQ